MILLAGEAKVVVQKEETESSVKTLAQESESNKAFFCFSVPFRYPFLIFLSCCCRAAPPLTDRAFLNKVTIRPTHLTQF